ncbi:cytidylyltransferase domain-containing protein [Celeribacter sp.]|uniref:cytidylyltransferase domain-containing protein n=1 Tax=Celeribacter sp. TaxID=1890673 RepID=UPI003A913056
MTHSDTSPAGPVKTACIILARGGSKGVPRKNLRPVGGISLVGRSVMAGKSAQGVDHVVVSTDDEEIAREARRYGGEVLWRPEELADDTASSEVGWLHAYHELKREHPALNRLVFLQCTSPFTTGADIDGCLAEMTQKGADCALSVLPDHSFLWGYGEAGFGVGLNHNERAQRKRRQDLPPSFRESGAIYCVDAEAFVRTGQRFCGPVALYPVGHPPVEIDTLADFDLCSMIANTGKQPMIGAERLAAVKALIMDFDGVHTDNKVIVDETGRESVVTSRGDGMGLSMLRASGRYRLLILSKERNPVVLRRAEKLGIDVFHAVDDKVAALDTWLPKQGLRWEDVLYVGNDVNDLGPIRKAGLSAGPSDSHPDVLREIDWVLPHPGGNGALRSLCDTLLACTS